MSEIQLNAIVSQKILLSDELMILRVVPDGWEIPDFKPGQYCAMGLPGSYPRVGSAGPEKKKSDPDKLIRRAYSLASPPSEKRYLEIFIILVPDGALTPRLFQLKMGDRIFVQPKITGLFTLDGVPEDANVIFASTGTGLAPYLSMIRHGFIKETKRRFAVIHGVRHSWDLGYRSELEMLARANPHFEYIHAISRPKAEHVPWNGLTGYVQDIWKNKVLDAKWGFRPVPDNTHVFLCGNPGMIDQMSEILGGEGFVEHTRKTPGQIHIERYW